MLAKLLYATNLHENKYNRILMFKLYDKYTYNFEN